MNLVIYSVKSITFSKGWLRVLFWPSFTRTPQLLFRFSNCLKKLRPKVTVKVMESLPVTHENCFALNRLSQKLAQYGIRGLNEPITDLSEPRRRSLASQEGGAYLNRREEPSEPGGRSPASETSSNSPCPEIKATEMLLSTIHPTEYGCLAVLRRRKKM